MILNVMRLFCLLKLMDVKFQWVPKLIKINKDLLRNGFTVSRNVHYYTYVCWGSLGAVLYLIFYIWKQVLLILCELSRYENIIPT